jgi:hypothetical protein
VLDTLATGPIFGRSVDRNIESTDRPQWQAIECDFYMLVVHEKTFGSRVELFELARLPSVRPKWSPPGDGMPTAPFETAY